MNMRIGIAYDLKHDFLIEEGGPDDWLEEYDSEGTIQAVQDAIEALGHEAVRLGGGRNFLERIRKSKTNIKNKRHEEEETEEKITIERDAQKTLRAQQQYKIIYDDEPVQPVFNFG